MRTASSIFVFAIVAAIQGHAQPATTTTPDTSPAARLKEYEATYQAGLKKIQTPLLSDYAAKLQQLALTAAPADQPAIKAELDRVQKIITDGGIIDLRSASNPQSTPPPKPPGSPPGNGPGPGGPRPLAGAVLVLRPDTAKGPAVFGSSITIGKAQWTVDHLDSGTYDISVICSFSSFTGKASLVASLAGDQAREDLSEARASNSPDQFRLLRLGKVRLDDDVTSKDLTLELDSTDLTGVQIRQVIISKPRPLAK